MRRLTDAGQRTPVANARGIDSVDGTMDIMTTRGSYEIGVSRRAEIIAVALEQFGESGYNGTSLRSIAGRVGISHPGLLHHFNSKVDLLRAVLEERENQSANVYFANSTEPMDVLRGIIALTESNTHKKGIVELYCVLSAEATARSHPAHAYFVERYRRVRLNVTAALCALQSDGRLRAGINPTGAANSLIALSDGLQVQWLLEPEVIDMTASTREAVQELLSVDLDSGLPLPSYAGK